MLFIHFILCKEKLETSFVSLVSREFHGVEHTIFMSTNWKKKWPPVKWTAEHVLSQV